MRYDITELYSYCTREITAYIQSNNLENAGYEVEDIMRFAVDASLHFKPQYAHDGNLDSEYSNYLEQIAIGLESYYEESSESPSGEIEFLDESAYNGGTDSYNMAYNLSDMLSEVYRYVVTNINEQYRDDMSDGLISVGEKWYISINKNDYFNTFSEDTADIPLHVDQPYSMYDYRGTYILFSNFFKNEKITELEFKLFIENLYTIDMTDKEEFKMQLLRCYMRNFDKYNAVIEDMCTLAYALPINVVKNFSGWLDQSLKARIIKNVDIQ